MGRKTGSYKFDKRRRELEKKKKKAEKQARKHSKNGEGDDAPPVEPSPDPALLDWVPPDTSSQS